MGRVVRLYTKSSGKSFKCPLVHMAKLRDLPDIEACEDTGLLSRWGMAHAIRDKGKVDDECCKVPIMIHSDEEVWADHRPLGRKLYQGSPRQ